MKLHEEKALAEILRTCRALATNLRVSIEAAEDIVNNSDESFNNLWADINEQSTAAGNIEDWLDRLPINEDGTAAADHM